MSTSHGTEEKSNSAWRLLINFLLYVSPVALLTTVFPMVTPTINRYNLDGVPLIQVILAASITVPWLSQAACLPLYRAIQMEHKKIADARVFTLKPSSTSSSAPKHEPYAHACPNRSSRTLPT